MQKNKQWFILMGAGLGMIFGYALWNTATGLVLGAAIGLVLFTLDKRNKK